VVIRVSPAHRGSGKTSLVTAGVISKLKSRMISANKNPVFLVVIPGTDPFADLLSSIHEAAGDPALPKTVQSLAQPLVDKSSEDANLQGLLYRSTWLLADALSEDKKNDQAEVEYQHALNIATELLRLTDGDLTSNRGVAFVEPKLGDTCLIRKDIDCALVHYRKALAINQWLLSGLAKDDPVKADVQRDLAANMVRMSTFF
jgi:tetratricopeptide (TPR) repeat protein